MLPVPRILGSPGRDPPGLPNLRSSGSRLGPQGPQVPQVPPGPQGLPGPRALRARFPQVFGVLRVFQFSVAPVPPVPQGLRGPRVLRVFRVLGFLRFLRVFRVLRVLRVFGLLDPQPKTSRLGTKFSSFPVARAIRAGSSNRISNFPGIFSTAPGSCRYQGNRTVFPEYIPV